MPLLVYIVQYFLFIGGGPGITTFNNKIRYGK